MNLPQILPIDPSTDTHVAVVWERVGWGLWLPDTARSCWHLELEINAGTPERFELRILGSDQVVSFPFENRAREIEWPSLRVTPDGPLVWWVRPVATVSVCFSARRDGAAKAGAEQRSHRESNAPTAV
jgi:hypothetical protein